MTGFTFDDIPKQAGVTALVTGANTGIGYHIADELARRGARVLLACRSEDKARDAMAKIAAHTPAADLAFVACDLADLSSVEAAAQTVGKERKLDLLIANAGVMMPPLGHATAGTELQFAVNHLGHFALIGHLLDRLAQDGGGRVVIQSSIAHKRGRIDFDNLDAAKGYDRQRFYAQSKLADLLMAFEFDRRLRAAKSPVAAIGCHPGVAQSELMRHLGAATLLGPLMGVVLNSARQGALPALQAATDPRVTSGSYLGPYGFMEVRGNSSGRAFATDTAQDPLLAARLWETSIEMTGVDPGLAPVD
ncbi:SDR family NAD(P)-dependent oxidoreductase [Erythrobacter sp. 3-20A1M]|uniref:oxidoreductase n=1 Tax=Erythrobacter sp. 3-20A1M TaxID=2653850 RepID=UPI001BFC7545|nr:oxidoreductase [Erythrobacter sp. 3-20A1M]QWC56375.1 SDR family NAD(P)-dependent oxidoreductase [Erythrobacter sp. 3-20A1M]